MRLIDYDISMREEGFTSIPNYILEAYLRAKLSPYQGRAFWAIARMTFGWQKPDGDTIALRQFNKLTGIERRNIDRTARKLEQRHIISIHRNGRNAASYRINRDVSEWLLSSPQMTARKPARRVPVVSTDDSLSSPQMTQLSSVETLVLSSPETPSEETLKEKKETLKERRGTPTGFLEEPTAPASDTKPAGKQKSLMADYLAFQAKHPTDITYQKWITTYA